MQLMGGPLFGRLGDMYGSRFAMLLAFMSASLCYFLVGLSTNVVLLFVSRLAVVFMHPSQGNQGVNSLLARLIWKDIHELYEPCLYPINSFKNTSNFKELWAVLFIYLGPH